MFSQSIDSVSVTLDEVSGGGGSAAESLVSFWRT